MTKETKASKVAPKVEPDKKLMQKLKDRMKPGEELNSKALAKELLGNDSKLECADIVRALKALRDEGSVVYLANKNPKKPGKWISSTPIVKEKKVEKVEKPKAAKAAKPAKAIKPVNLSIKVEPLDVRDIAKEIVSVLDKISDVLGIVAKLEAKKPEERVKTCAKAGGELKALKQQLEDLAAKAKMAI